MANPTTARKLSAIETAVLETVVYSDLFDFPLTPDEVWRFLPRAATREEVDEALDGLTGRYLASVPPYFTIAKREQVATVRERRRVSSTALSIKAERYGRWIARLPFVRMVAVTGSLAADNADEGDDLDYLIVVAPGRVWLTRAMTMVIVRLAALRGTIVCPNYLLAADHLTLRTCDLYTARELLQMRPVAGHHVYARMLAANDWWREYLPNAAPAVVATGEPAHPSILRRVAEAVLRTRPIDALETWLLWHKGDELRRAATGDEAVFDETMCKGHFEGWRERSRRAIAVRMAALLEERP